MIYFILVSPVHEHMVICLQDCGRLPDCGPPRCRVRQWAEALLWDRRPDGPDVFRMKGVLNAAVSDRQHLLQVGRKLGWPH
jgi:hypothetical protein